MSSFSKGKNANIFYEQYQHLTETKKALFAKLCDNLLNENFIYGQLQKDRNDYYSILEFKEIIEAYFALIDFDLIHDDMRKIFYLKTTADRNRIKLKKYETVTLIILRKFYYTNSKQNLDSNVNITVTIDEVVDYIKHSGIYKESDVGKTQTIECLKVLKKYKIVNFDANNFETNNVIEIFPTILLVVNINDLEALDNKLDSYIAKGEASDYDFEED